MTPIESETTRLLLSQPDRHNGETAHGGASAYRWAMPRSHESSPPTPRSARRRSGVLSAALLLAGGCGGGSPADLENAQCRLLTATARHEPDDTPYQSDTFTYDDVGNLQTWVRDDRGYTASDRSFRGTYTYIELPEVHRREVEVDLDLEDGWTERIACVYASANLPMQLSRGLEGEVTSGSCVDEGADGVLSRDDQFEDGYSERDAYTYDAFGNPKIEDVDEGIDGTVDEHGSHRYTYDANGRVLTDNFIDDHAGPNYNYGDYVDAFTYDADGRVLTESLDDNHDRLIDVVRSFTYDPDGRLLNEDVDTGPNNATNDRITYTYGEDGQLQTVFSYIDLPSDHMWARRYTFTHDERGNVVVVVVDSGSDDLSKFQYDYTDRYTYEC